MEDDTEAAALEASAPAAHQAVGLQAASEEESESEEEEEEAPAGAQEFLRDGLILECFGQLHAHSMPRVHNS